VEYFVNVIAEDTMPPIVTDPSANPSSIVADGIQQSQLNVTVTDKCGIYSVTVNLSSLGETSAKEMIKIEGSDIYTTTTIAAIGTLPETYDLQIKATDNSPNRNSNMSECIQLTVTSPVTTYDFSTGAGADKWAYRKQHNAKPSTTNDVPSKKFEAGHYKKIESNDGKMREDSASSKGYYAIHRFKFTIAEPEESITKIHILWNGEGTKKGGVVNAALYIWDYVFGGGRGKKEEAIHGATLYIWNFNTGEYEQQDTNASEEPIALKGTIVDNTGNYIKDDDGAMIIIAEQNTASDRGMKSTIRTDYVKVDITR
jgi:hypothetical protein